MSRREQTAPEEVANSITHGLGILFCLAGIPFLVLNALKTGNMAMVWAVSIFGFGMLMVYFSSTLYHVARNANTKRTLRVWDHISIYLLIAGTYTPLVVKYADSKTAVIFLSFLWSIVAVGAFMKIFFTGGFNLLSTLLYVAMGWMAVLIIKPLASHMPANVFYWIVAGGISYTVGVIFYAWSKLTYGHAVWHVFVLTGTITHFFAVYYSIPLNTQM
jgi:hemolysin III